MDCLPYIMILKFRLKAKPIQTVKPLSACRPGQLIFFFIP